MLHRDALSMHYIETITFVKGLASIEHAKKIHW